MKLLTIIVSYLLSSSVVTAGHWAHSFTPLGSHHVLAHQGKSYGQGNPRYLNYHHNQQKNPYHGHKVNYGHHHHHHHDHFHGHGATHGHHIHHHHDPHYGLGKYHIHKNIGNDPKLPYEQKIVSTQQGTCDDKYEYNTAYHLHGNLVPCEKFPCKRAKSMKKCAEHCSYYPGCSHWTWHAPSYGCHLVESRGNTAQGNAKFFVSGNCKPIIQKSESITDSVQGSNKGFEGLAEEDNPKDTDSMLGNQEVKEESPQPLGKGGDDGNEEDIDVSDESSYSNLEYHYDESGKSYEEGEFWSQEDFTDNLENETDEPRSGEHNLSTSSETDNEEYGEEEEFMGQEESNDNENDGEEYTNGEEEVDYSIDEELHFSTENDDDVSSSTESHTENFEKEDGSEEQGGSGYKEYPGDDYEED